MGISWLKVSMVQANSTVGGINSNLERVKAEAIEANRMGSNIIIFPEMFLSGYQPLDLVKKRFFLRQIAAELENLAKEMMELDLIILIGAPYLLNEKIYNAFFSIHKGTVVAVGKKFHLPNYDVFDEKRYFNSSGNIEVVEILGVKIGFPICEDAWYSDVIFQLKQQGAQLIIIPNGSPYESNKLAKRHATIQMRCIESNLPIVYLNLIGGQDELVFDGGSFVCNQKGSVVCQFPQFKECTYQITFEIKNSCLFPLKGIIKENGTSLSQDYWAIVLGLRDYVLKSNFKQVVIGLSGGIDSALVAVMAVDALGSENVFCLALPSKFNSKSSLEDARKLAKNLDIQLQILEVQGIIDKVEDLLGTLFKNGERDLTEENLQSRLRAVLLMACSNKEGRLLLSTGNKSEIAVGYSTIYGDMAGAYNPLKDVYKTKVYRLCEWRNSLSNNDSCNQELIPINILLKEPSAELAYNQKDTDSLPDYSELDAILEFLIEDDLGVQEIIEKGYPEKTVIRVKNLLYLSEYKRYQSCPGPKISRKPFSLGRRYPLVNHWRDFI